MHKISKAALLAALCFAPSAAFAETVTTNDDTIVVTATRASGGIPREQLGGSVTLLSAADLELRQTQVLSDVLRDVPGVEVSRGGVIGGLTDIRIRGAEANHTLVLIDGMDASDVVNQQFEFSTLIADDVARVEVLRGQQSALYGSDAIGGVIQYLTATGTEAPGARARFEYGSFGTAEMSARVAGVNGPLDWAVSGNIFDTDGTNDIEGGHRDLAFESKTLAGRFGLQINDDLSLTAVVRSRDSRWDVNEDVDFDGIYLDSPGIYSESEAVYGLVRADLSTFNDAWTHSLTLQRAQGQSFSHSLIPFFGDTSNEGERNKASYVTTLHFGGDTFDQHLTGAIDYKEETFETSSIVGSRSIDQTGYVLDYNALVNGHLGFGAALRRDENSRFEGSTTYRVQASYALDTGTRLRAAAGSGIKNPTMTELFGFGGTFIGNPDLTPEKSEGWEIGVEQYLFGRDVLLGVTYFESDLTDEIGAVNFFTGPATNVVGQSTRNGVEVFAQAHFGAQWAIDLSYTHLDAEQPDGTPEPRRADNTASANISWRTAGDRGGLNLNVRYNGEQEDTFFPAFPNPPVPETLDAFTLVNIGANWKLTEALQVYGRVENALDEDYQEVFGYEGIGRAAYVGIRAGF
jgi:vitamin B12 transporter